MNISQIFNYMINSRTFPGFKQIQGFLSEPEESWRSCLCIPPTVCVTYKGEKIGDDFFVAMVHGKV